MNPPRAICIGALADTQVLFDQALVENYCGVDHIIHAGDIGNRTVTAQLEVLNSMGLHGGTPLSEIKLRGSTS